MTEGDALGSVTAWVSEFQSPGSSCFQNSLLSCPGSCVRKQQRMGDDWVPRVMPSGTGETAVLPGPGREPLSEDFPRWGIRGSGRLLLSDPRMVSRHPQLWMLVLAVSFQSPAWLLPFRHSDPSLNVTSPDREPEVPIICSPSSHQVLGLTVAFSLRDQLGALGNHNLSLHLGCRVWGSWALVLFPADPWCPEHRLAQGSHPRGVSE